ncbi:probable inactive ATP-dependent zinc metalloprotease FTSHI 3, chloroplastic [Pistacia vera]|uniref:probable inactive ATP-dependent zinc metalloprotease FTSHI 3, chloroplastic n=1 Tax=Pistacia vera TaxID=55513 RepID=UPI0012638C04|nr:probable inactive ATP-dependent zinc metalloprotease FTSHI 3, chloroplastic [Pistacia vera]
MACFSVVCNNGFLPTQENIGLYGVKTKSLMRYTSACYNASVGFYNCYWKSSHLLLCNNKFRFLNIGEFGVPLLGFYDCCKSQHGLCCSNGIRPLVKGSIEDKGTHLENRGNGKLRRRFSLRLRPRLRLLIVRLKRVSLRSVLNDIGMFLRKNIRRVTLSTLISVALGLCYLLVNLTTLPSPKIVPYSDLITSLQNGSVTKVLLEEGSRRIYYNTNVQSFDTTEITEEKSPVVNDSTENVDHMAAGNDGVRVGVAVNFNILKKFSRNQSSIPQWEFSTRKIDHDEKFLLCLMREKGTTYSSAPQSPLKSMRNILITVISLWIPLTPLMWLLYRQLSTANSPAKRRRSNKQMVNFDDVEGVDTAKVELMEIVSCLQGAINYQKLGAKLPRGVLLVGPPGTGKTLLARAVAGEAGVPFFTVSASEFVELFVGRGAARIRDLFSAARKCAPAIIFIDELDAVGGKRGRSFNDERDQTLNQLLTEMDGFESDMKVVVIAATNRPEALDPALCRPGRFSRKVLVGEPDEEGRRKILSVHLRGIPLEEDTRLIGDLVASVTPGFVGADLANIVNESALLAARRGSETVTREDIMEAIERAKFGINDRQLKPTKISEELGKIFPWIPSLMGRNDTKQDSLPGPLGYQTLS